MKKQVITIINKQFSKRQPFYLKDPNSDIFVIINEKIYPLHKYILADVGYFGKQDMENKKVHVVSENINQKHFQLIIGYLYGKQFQFQRNWSIKQLLGSIRTLDVPLLQNAIMQDIMINFDEYGFFLLLAIAHKYKIKWLKQKCQQQLILMGFQQLNYNRYDLFQVDQQTLEQILKLHQILKSNANIVGLRKQDLKRIINQYCTVNNVNIQIDQILTSCQSSVKFYKTLDSTNDFSPFKKNGIIDTISYSSTELEGEEDKSKNSESTKNISDYSQCSVGIPNDQRNQQLQRLKTINTQINIQNNNLIVVIQNVKNTIQNSNQNHNENNLQGINQQLRKFEKVCQQQNAKFQSLKLQMQKLSPMKNTSFIKDNKYLENKNKNKVSQNKYQFLSQQEHSPPLQKIINKKKISQKLHYIPKLNPNFES